MLSATVWLTCGKGSAFNGGKGMRSGGACSSSGPYAVFCPCTLQACPPLVGSSKPQADAAASKRSEPEAVLCSWFVERRRFVLETLSQS